MAETGAGTKPLPADARRRGRNFSSTIAAPASSLSAMPPPASPPWKKIVLWSVPAFLLLLVVGGFAVRRGIDAYLRSEQFRTFLAQKAGGTLRAEAEIAPLHFEGANLFTDRFSARGTTAAKFSSLQIEGARAEVSLRHFFEHAWRVEQLDVQRLRVDLVGARLPAAATEPKVVKDRIADANRSRWLPDRVEIGTAVIRDLQLTWEEGALRGTALQLQPTDDGWTINGSGGSITHGALPPLSVHRLDLASRGSSLFVRAAELRQGEGGSVIADGEVNFEERLDLHAVLRGVALTPWLAGDWRARLRGDASGEVNVRCPLPIRGSPEITGQLTLENGVLEALPVLNQIAAFTKTQQFRRLKLTRASADFTQQEPRLTVRNLVAESEGLIRVEGGFFIERGVIEGNFQVGVTPASLQWLPGSQARVFTENRAGYLWAPMRLAGPVASPKEDLTERLIAAAGTEVIEQLGGAAKDATKQLKDAAKSAFDLLLGPGR